MSQSGARATFGTRPVRRSTAGAAAVPLRKIKPTYHRAVTNTLVFACVAAAVLLIGVTILLGRKSPRPSLAERPVAGESQVVHEDADQEYERRRREKGLADTSRTGGMAIEAAAASSSAAVADVQPARPVAGSGLASEMREGGDQRKSVTAGVSQPAASSVTPEAASPLAGTGAGGNVQSAEVRPTPRAASWNAAVSSPERASHHAIETGALPAPIEEQPQRVAVATASPSEIATTDKPRPSRDVHGDWVAPPRPEATAVIADLGKSGSIEPMRQGGAGATEPKPTGAAIPSDRAAKATTPVLDQSSDLAVATALPARAIEREIGTKAAALDRQVVADKPGSRVEPVPASSIEPHEPASLPAATATTTTQGAAAIAAAAAAVKPVPGAAMLEMPGDRAAAKGERKTADVALVSANRQPARPQVSATPPAQSAPPVQSAGMLDAAAAEIKSAGAVPVRGDGDPNAAVGSTWRTWISSISARVTNVLQRAGRPAVADGSVKDCQACPGLTVIPPGYFLSSAGSGGGVHQHAVQTRVRIGRSFAISQSPVSVGEYVTFLAATGHPRPACGSALAQSATQPITCVSYDDARAYLRWLGGQSGQLYRLPSAAEWEYSSRRSTDLDDPKAEWVNVFGLSGMGSHVAELVADCWLDNGRAVATDGGAIRHDGRCTTRMMMGYAAAEASAGLEIAARRPVDRLKGLAVAGFRVVRDADDRTAN